jgi:polyhydroxyalkanoate synthesis regulator phasin
MIVDLSLFVPLLPWIVALGGLGGLAAMVNARTTALTAIVSAQTAYIARLERRVEILEAGRGEDQATIERQTCEIGELRRRIGELEDERAGLIESIAALKAERQTRKQPTEAGARATG